MLFTRPDNVPGAAAGPLTDLASLSRKLFFQQKKPGAYFRFPDKPAGLVIPAVQDSHGGKIL